MRKTIYLLLTFAMFACVSFAQEAKQGARIVFKEIVKDLGEFPESEPTATCVFEFTNEGDAPLVIHRAQASCGCTVPKYPKEPVMPGEKGTVTVNYNGAGKHPGPFKKSIRLMTNANPEMAIIYVKGKMTEVGVGKDKTMLDR